MSGKSTVINSILSKGNIAFTVSLRSPETFFHSKLLTATGRVSRELYSCRPALHERFRGSD